MSVNPEQEIRPKAMSMANPSLRDVDDNQSEKDNISNSPFRVNGFEGMTYEFSPEEVGSGTQSCGNCIKNKVIIDQLCAALKDMFVRQD